MRIQILAALDGPKLCRVMAKWGSQGLDDIASIRQKLQELGRSNSDQTSSSSGLGPNELKSDLPPVPEEQPTHLSVETVVNQAAASASLSPFASAADLSGYEASG